MKIKDTIFIDTVQGIKDLVDWVSSLETWIGDLQPQLYIDLEGERLSRNGTISLMTILVYPRGGLHYPRIIDIHKLGKAAFSTTGTRATSLKDILESNEILKVFFDVRNDSDALYAHYGIQMRGVLDVQLMESALRPGRRMYLSSLSKCMEGVLSPQESQAWKACKEAGESLWKPEKGGSYNVFNERPLRKEIEAYCAGDVQHLPALYRKHRSGTVRWMDLVKQETQKRVDESQKPGYQPEGPDRALSPWSAEQNATLDSWCEVPKPKPKTDYFSLHDMDDFREDFLDFDDDNDDFYDHWDDSNDYEDWTRADWQGPPS